MNNEVYAAVMASISGIQNLTNDRIEALTKGHGMTNIGAMCCKCYCHRAFPCQYHAYR